MQNAGSSNNSPTWRAPNEFDQFVGIDTANAITLSQYVSYQSDIIENEMLELGDVFPQPIDVEENARRCDEISQMLKNTPGILSGDGKLSSRRTHRNRTSEEPVLWNCRLPVLMDERYFRMEPSATGDDDTRSQSSSTVTSTDRSDRDQTIDKDIRLFYGNGSNAWVYSLFSFFFFFHCIVRVSHVGQCCES